MKKIVFNVSDALFEKIRFEAMAEQKSIQDIILERLLYKPFEEEIIIAYDEWMNKEIEKIMSE